MLPDGVGSLNAKFADDGRDIRILLLDYGNNLFDNLKLGRQSISVHFSYESTIGITAD